jgi:hypothetical protein
MLIIEIPIILFTATMSWLMIHFRDRIADGIVKSRSLVFEDNMEEWRKARVVAVAVGLVFGLMTCLLIMGFWYGDPGGP